MKHILNILVTTLFAAALMQLGYTHMELKTNCEALAWQMKNTTDQLDAIVTANSQRMRRDAQKMAELEARIESLTGGAGQLTSSR